MPQARATRRTFIGLGSAALVGSLSSPALASEWRRFAETISGAELTGQVILPDSPGYDEARRTFNSRISRFPAAIVRCQSAADVQNAVRWANQNGVPLRARSGGHSYEAFSVVDGGLVIDVSPLNAISVDLARGEAVVGAGVRLHELYQGLWAHGVTLPAGTCPLVGVAGLTLGGGIGFLARERGLTCDNLVAAEVVDANGDMLLASATEHKDLFWALRGGGGGNFGIVTSFTFRAQPIGNVVIASLTWPRDEIASVIDAWQHWAPETDTRLTAGLNIPTSGEVNCTGLFTGPEAELSALLTPLIAAAPAAASTFYSTRFIDFIVAPGSPPLHAIFKNTSTLAYEPLSTAGIATFVDYMNEALPPGANLVQLFPFGGAIRAVDPTRTAFVHRQALFDLQYQAYWWDPAHEAAHVAWIRDFRAAMVPHMRGAYVNYIDADITNWADEYYGANLPALKRVKAKYDPGNVFNGPQRIQT